MFDAEEAAKEIIEQVNTAATVHALKENLKLQVRALVETNRQLVGMAPHLEVTLRQLLLVPPAELDGAVERLAASIPGAQARVKALTALCQAIGAAQETADYTKERLDRRVQPEGQERVYRPFKSFCRRKPSW
jgi:hypothetical protein